MKAFASLAIVAVSCIRLAGAEKGIDMDRHFAFPRTAIVMESAEVRVVAECSGCFRHTTPQSPEPHFAGGHEFEGGTSVGWEFVRQTGRGDVYLITVERKGKPEAVTAVLFTGTPLVVISDHQLKVELFPERPKSK